MNIVVVDGYNIIGAWDELEKMKQNDIGQARDRLIELMAEYQAYSNCRVIIVFDAHYVKGLKRTQNAFKVKVIYTKENETADECIEKLVTNYKTIQNQVYVATSDYMEQRIIFGRGALRKSARELLIELKAIKTKIKKDIERQRELQQPVKLPLDQKVLETFEKWRRGRWS